MAEWIECKISDIGTVVGGATPSTKKPENYENGTIAWITPKDLSTFSGRNRIEKLFYRVVTEEYGVVFFKGTNRVCGYCCK